MTLQQAAAELGLPPSLLARLYAAWELARPEPEQPLRADDAELLRLAVLGHSAFGHDETVTLGIARQLGASLRRLAESQILLFRTLWVPRISSVALTWRFAPVADVRDDRQPWKR